MEPQEEEVPPADEEQGESPLHWSNGPGEVVGDWEPAGSQYDWDDEGNEEGPTLAEGALDISCCTTSQPTPVHRLIPYLGQS